MGIGERRIAGQSVEIGARPTEEQDLWGSRDTRIYEIPYNSANDKPSATKIPTGPQSTGKHSNAPETLWDHWLSHRKRLLRQCIRMTSGDIADAEDALGEALVQAASHFEDGRGSRIRDPRAWRSRLAHNSCVDFVRVRASQRRRTEQVIGMGEASPTSPAPIPNPEAVMLANEALRQLEKKLDEIPNVLRVTFVLRFGEGLAYAEIANRLGISSATARKRIQLARDRLRGYRSAAPH